MNKLLLLALIVGAVSAGASKHTVMGYGSGGMQQLWDLTNIFKIEYKYDLEWYYQTIYFGGPDANVLPALANKESYGFETGTFVNGTVRFTFFEMYRWQGMVSFVPIDVTPYLQTISWYRPEEYVL